MQRRHAITERLAELKSWRYGVTNQIERVLGFLREHDFASAALESRLAKIRALVERETVTVAFIAEVGRGKSALINALFFSDQLVKLLPSGRGQSTRCVTELRFRADEQTGIRLLPIESRESPRRLDDFDASETDWRTVLFDADNPDSVRRAFGTLAETRRITMSEAVAWGLHGEALGNVVDGGWVDVPRWRYAKINFPHPLLDAGLVILDTPGMAALTAEPELARERIPKADAVILVLDAAEGVTKSDLAIWKDQLGGSRNFRERERDESAQSRLIALNKIDTLRKDDALDPQDGDRQWLREIDKRVQDIADLMRVEPIKIIPVSAQYAEEGRQIKSADLSLKSRVYQLERALAQNLPTSRHTLMTREIVGYLSTAIEDAQTQLDQSRFEALEGLRLLAEIRHKNETLSDTIEREALSRSDALTRIAREVVSAKPVHAKLAQELRSLSDPELAKQDIATAKLAIAQGLLTGTINEALSNYFGTTRKRLTALEEKFDEVRTLFGNIGENVFRAIGLGHYELHTFATQRFMTEVDKAEEKVRAEMARTSNLLVRRGNALAEQFEQIVDPAVVHVFEIAHRESATWMRGLFQSIEHPLEEVHGKLMTRAGKVEKIRAVELDLAEKIADFQANLDVIKSKHRSLGLAREGLERFAGKRPDDE